MIQMLECLKLSQMFLSLSSFFWILVSSLCSSWMFISSFCSKSLIWVLLFFPYTFAVLNDSLSIIITIVLNSASDRLAISLSLSSIFGGFDLFFHLGHISLSWHTCYVVRGGALGICWDGATPKLSFGAICGGGVREGTIPPAWHLPCFQSLHPLPMFN